MFTSCALRSCHILSWGRVLILPMLPADLQKQMEKSVGKQNAFSLVCSRWVLMVSTWHLVIPVWVPEGQAQRCGKEMPSPQLSPALSLASCLLLALSIESFPASKLLGIDFLSACSWLLHFQSSFKGHSKVQSCIYMFQIPHNTFRGASAQLVPAHFYHSPVQS